MDENLAWRVEDACLQAWPALKESVLDGWVLRFSEGISRRANSANPLRGARGDSAAFIGLCEERYRAEGLPVIFRIPSFLAPALATMQSHLDQLGYQSEAETLALHGALDSAKVDADADVTVRSHADEEWLSAIARLQRHNEERRRVYPRLIASITAPAAFALLRDEGRVVAASYGAMQDGLFCLESVVTDAAFRGRGYAKRVLKALLFHIQSRAWSVCLQVQADNAAARRLYTGIGFREIYRYWYCVKDTGYMSR